VVDQEGPSSFPDDNPPSCVQGYVNIQMFLFRAFDLYVVKVLGGHPKDKR
jgi:hypothetical protein